MRSQIVASYVERWLPTNAIGRNVIQLASGTAGGQLILVMASPVLAHLYTPRDFGILGVYAAIQGILAIIVTGRYQMAIPLPRSERTAATLVIVVIAVVALMTLVNIVLFTFFGSFILRNLNALELEPFLSLLVLAIALVGLYDGFSYFALRQKAFKSVGDTKVHQGLLTVCIQVISGLLGMGSAGLLLGQTFGRSAGVIRFSKSYRSALSSRRKLSYRGALACAKKYSNFPLFSSWSALANLAGTWMPLLLFSAWFTPVQAGFYLMAVRATQMPMSLVGQSLGQVFLAHAADALRNGNLGDLTRNAFQSLLLIASGPLLFFAAIAPEVFSCLFGTEWLEAGQYAQWMTPWILIVFALAPLSTLYSVLGKQRTDLAFQLILFATRIIALKIGAEFESPILAVALFSVGSALIWVAFGSPLMRDAGCAYRKQFGILVLELLRGIPLLTIILALKWFYIVPKNLEIRTVGLLLLVAFIFATTIHAALFTIPNVKKILKELRS